MKLSIQAAATRPRARFQLPEKFMGWVMASYRSMLKKVSNGVKFFQKEQMSRSVPT